MLVKLVTLRFDARLGGFDERPLAELLRDREVLAVSEHFFVHDEVPHWAFMVTYRVPEADGEPAPARERARGAPAYREVLREEDWPLFNSLRDWRSGVAAKEGVPPYIIVPNDVLAWIARERPRTLNALGQIRGMGAARLKRHGRAILAALGVSVGVGGDGALEAEQPPPSADGAEAARQQEGGAGSPAAGPDAEGPVAEADVVSVEADDAAP